MRLFISILLLVHGFVAAYCGMLLMHDVSGSDIGLQLSYLQHSPFSDYYIPGFILFTVLGLGSIAASVCGLYRIRHYSYCIMVIGLGIIIWIITQLLMTRMLFFMQFIIGLIGFLAMLCGFALLKKEKTIKQTS
jgi:hypothetical protein